MAVEVMMHLIYHDAAHGYSQPNRAGDGTVETIRLSDDTLVKIHGGDYDCSESMRMCYAAIGVLAWGYWDSYMWTGNELEVLRAAGFVQVNKYAPKAGDVLWRQGHTELYLGNNRQGGARRSELHSVTGAKGDQDGGEITLSAYNPNEWTIVLRCTKVRSGTGEHDVEKPATSNVKIPSAGQTEDEMISIIQPDGESYLEYFDGTKTHKLGTPKEAEAIEEVYRKTHGGKEIPKIVLGSKKSPKAKYLHAAIAR